jgi:DNA ligase-1
MDSPSKKKRRLNPAPKANNTSQKGLEYFFAKQKEESSSASKGSPSQEASHLGEDHLLNDEEFARRLQDEWNKESSAEILNLQQGSEKKGILPAASVSSASKDQEAAPFRPDQPAASVAPKRNILSLSSTASIEDEASSQIPLDESPLTFLPSRYIGQLQASWASHGGDASYALLTRCFVLVNGTPSRIKIVDTLVNCVRLIIESDPSSLVPAVWLATNSISPPHVSMELGLGGSAISKALKQVCGLDNRSLKAIYDKLGDPGDVAFEAKKKQSFTLRKPKPHTIKSVYLSLVKIASTQGQGSAEAKQRIVDKLLQDARGGEESRYIVRTLCQHVSLFRPPFFG